MKRIVIEQKEFKVEGTFNSMYAANEWIIEKGYMIGSTDCDPKGGHRAAIMKGDYYAYSLPHKMKNFTKKQIDLIHGIMKGNLREGPVTVELYV